MKAYSPAPAEAIGGQALAAARSAAWRLANLLAAPFVATARYNRIQRTAKMLQELDDRTLADIGLRRTQIISTATQVIDWPHVDPRHFVR